MEERVGMVRLYCKFENAAEVQRQWRHHFDTDPPVRETILATYQKFLDTGSADAERSGRPVSVLTAENLQEVKNRIRKRPQKSVRRGSAEAGMSYESYRTALHKLGLKVYPPQLVVELSDSDFDSSRSFAKRSCSVSKRRQDLLERRVAVST